MGSPARIFFAGAGFVLEFVAFPGHFVAGGGFYPGICGVSGTFCYKRKVLSWFCGRNEDIWMLCGEMGYFVIFAPCNNLPQ
jgi:hypothetical protein